MITFLEGKLEEALPTQIIVNVGGIGYQVLIPLSSYDRLPEPGAAVRILTQLVIREDEHLLIGFWTKSERDLYRLLVHHVTGVGPKLALAILSGMSVEQFKAAVVASDTAAISKRYFPKSTRQLERISSSRPPTSAYSLTTAFLNS